jgi:predicted acyltransferase
MNQVKASSNLSQRLLSLDIFRGLTVACMILVNNPGEWGHVYPPLKHAVWNGCTPTDLVFPFFLFIVGVSVSYALANKKTQGASQHQIILQAVRRMLILFGLGLFLNSFPALFIEPVQALKTIRIPGVLQRIALVYFLCVLLFLKTSHRTQQWLFVGILLLYWLLQTLIPVPGTGVAQLEPGADLGAWLDRLIFTEAHLYKAAKTWDPEGLLSTLPSVATGLAGVLCGSFLRNATITPPVKAAWLCCTGFLFFIAGLVWDWAFPINKALWTSSYVLYTGGLALSMLGLLYWLIDVQGYKRYHLFFLVFGVNAITAYCLSALVPRILSLIRFSKDDGSVTNVRDHLYHSLIAPWFSPMTASLAGAVMLVLFLQVILWIMYKRNLLIKI